MKLFASKSGKEGWCVLTKTLLLHGKNGRVMI